MRTIFFVIPWIFLLAVNCCDEDSNKCAASKIFDSGNVCLGFEIHLNDHLYPVDNLPSEFKKNEMKVCIKYELYEDARMCICCGGTRMKILSIKAL